MFQHSRRLLSSANALQKLQIAVENFRIQNYAYELPSRCKKEIIKAVDKQGSGVVSAEALTKLLDNIGASAMLSKSEVESIIHEFGDRSKSTIHVDKMIKLM